MCTVRELIEKLGELDPDTNVQVIGMYSNGHGGRDNEWVDLDVSEYYGQHSSDIPRFNVEHGTGFEPAKHNVSD